MKAKLTATEKRALSMCQHIQESTPTGGSYPLIVEWVRSAAWGSNPRIMHRGEKVTNVSGCGYCKHSAALADALRFLGRTDEERHAIHRTGGAGVSRVREALLKTGWKLEPVASGKSFDAYILTRA